MKKYNIAVIGYGGMGSWHTRELLQLSDIINLAGIWDISPARQQVARDNGIHVYTSQEDVLSDPAVDIVTIATPNDFHKPIAIDAMNHGKNVVSEKPVTLSTSDLDEMIAASKRTGKLFTVHQNRRWDEDYLTAKAVVASGELGPIHRIESRVQGSRGIPGDWRQLPEKGGGMVLDWGVHLLDQALQFFPEEKVTSVYAILTNITNTLVDDGVTCDLLFTNGIHYIIDVGTSNFISLPRWNILGRDGTAVIRDWDLSGEIVCAHGKTETDVVPVITAAGLTKTMAPRREENITKKPLPVQHSDVRDFYRNICDTLSGTAQINITLPQQSRLMHLMEAIFQSAKDGQVVHQEI